MSYPKQAAPTMADVIAAAPADRSALVRAATSAIFARLRDRREAGLCGECDEPIAGGDMYGDTYCVEHARLVEIYIIAATAEDDDA